MATINIADLNLQNPLEAANRLIAPTIKSNEEKLKHLQKKPTSSFETDKQVLRKVNVPFAGKLYKDLIDLDVRDKDILKECTAHRLKSVPVKKDPDLNLQDFYQPNFNEEFCYQLPTYRPSLQKIREYNGFSISSKYKYILD